MMFGTVNQAHEAVLPVRVFGPTGFADVFAVIDTGCTAMLTLPNDTAMALGLVWNSKSLVVLADGTDQEYDVFEAEVEWDGTRQQVLIYAVGDDVLLGMGLLAGHELRIEVAPGGAVEIRPLP